MDLGSRIRQQRMQHGWSQEKLAELMGVSRQAVTKWETGRSAPTADKLYELAQLFGTTVDLLMPPASPEPPAPPAPAPERVIIRTVYVEKPKPEPPPPSPWISRLRWIALGCFLVCFIALMLCFAAWTQDQLDLMEGSARVLNAFFWCGNAATVIRLLISIPQKTD